MNNLDDPIIATLHKLEPGTICSLGTADDPIIAALHKHINGIAEMCNKHIKPWEPNAAWRAQRLWQELAEPYIKAMCEYVALRPKSAFSVAWCNSTEDLVPVGDTEDYLD